MKKYIAAFAALVLCLMLCACNPAPATPDAQQTDPAATEDTRDTALYQAQSLLSIANYSRQGLIELLVERGFSEVEAVTAVDACNANWTQQAVDSANTYLQDGAYSKGSLYHTLAFDGFTEEQILAALEGCEANWNQEALEAVQFWLQRSRYSEPAMYDQLLFEDFTEEEAAYALENCNVDWAEQALLRAKTLKEEGTSADMLAQTLVNEGYTQEQADYAAANA